VATHPGAACIGVLLPLAEGVRHNGVIVIAAMFIAGAFAGLAAAQPVPTTEFRPRFTSSLDSREGSCKLRLRIDDEAEVVMRNDRIVVRAVRGAPARDVGSECTGPLPSRGIQDFEFQQTDGRGRSEVIERPDRRNNSRVVIAVRDDKGGDDKYTLEFRWTSGSAFGGGFNSPSERPPFSGSFPVEEAISLCQDVVRGRIAEEHGYTNISILRTDSVVGRRDWFAGEATARRGGVRATFRFECNVSLDAGRVREARVTRR
jgi:hypothetical protein